MPKDNKDKEIEKAGAGLGLIAIVAGLVAANIFRGGFWFGAGVALLTFFVLALFVARELADSEQEENSKDCPFCGERIKQQAIKCKHCQSTL